MNDDKLFVIAIGGTGMRCLESFVHLCAIGMFDNKEIEILTLDTDQSNGNKSRVEGLVDLYNKIKTGSGETPGGRPNANTFFSAKLNLHKFWTDYASPQRKSYRALSQMSGTSQEQKQDNEDLADLLLDHDTVQEFELDHGYRAQTHLGSMLMYHGIVEAARNARKGGRGVKEHEEALQRFVQLLQKNSGSARVFVFGSVFGGTGASSIPVVPIALRDAVKIISGGANTLDLSKVKFGSTLLTDYFSFTTPTDQARQKDRVIADSNHFALNSQAALQFYIDDPTVKTFYKRLYHIGWPAGQKLDLSKEDPRVITGGKEQENPAHAVELMAACAAYDFFTEDVNENQATYLYRNIELDDNGNLRLTGTSFVNDGEKFENKLGAFFSYSLLALSKEGGAFGNPGSGNINIIERFARQDIHDYDTISNEECKELDDYLKMFAYNFVNGDAVKGWMYQIKDTVPGNFIFRPEAFRTSYSDLSRVDPGYIFTDDRHNWDATGGFLGMGRDRYDSFVKGLVNSVCYPMDDQNVETTKERYLAHMYNAITKAQKYDF